MIERYLEKDIRTQISIANLLLKKNEISIHDLTSTFKISRNTAVAYLLKIEELVIFDNVFIKYQKGKVELIGKENILAFELFQRIYSCSNWLQFIKQYLEGESMEMISNEGYISLSVVYKYKNLFEDYLTSIDKKSILLHDSEHENNYRMLKTYIYFLIGTTLNCSYSKNYTKWHEKVGQFIKQTCTDLKRNYLPESCQYIELALFIAINELENGYKMELPERLKFDLNQFPILEVVRQNLINENLDSLFDSEDEVCAIAMLFVQLPYVSIDIESFKTEFTRTNNYYLENIAEYKELIQRFKKEFGNQIETLIFYKAIVSFIDTMALDNQEFIPEKEFFLNEKDIDLKKKVKKIITEWSKECLPDDYVFKEKSINKLTKRISKVMCVKPEHIVRIVVSSDFEFEVIKNILNIQEIKEKLVIDPVIYFNLSKLENSESISNELVICSKEDYYCNGKKTIQYEFDNINHDIIIGLQKYDIL